MAHRGTATACDRTPCAAGRTTVALGPRGVQWYLVGVADRGTVERDAPAVSPVSNVSSAVSRLVSERGAGPHAPGLSQRLGAARAPRSLRMFYRRLLQWGQKRGACVGPTKRGKGTKIMAIADRAGLPVAIDVASASPAEVRLVEITLNQRFTRRLPHRLIGDKAYDSDPLDRQLRRRGVALIAPHKRNRCRPPTQDGRVLRRYRHRWKVERLFAWLHQFRRVVVRYEYHVLNYLGLLQLACIMILLRNYL